MKVKSYELNSIVENPHRNLGTYPTIEKKVAALVRSFQDVGVWEGIIGREHPTMPGACEIAFGHHRLEAAKRCGLKEIPIIIKDLNDEQMLQYMGRENGEDYGTQFLVMLNTWDGAFQFLGQVPGKIKPIDIGRVLGWTDIQADGWEGLNELGKGCAAAHALIIGGYLDRDDLSGLTVSQARHIVQRAQTRMEFIEKSSEQTGRPKHERETAKQSIAKGAKKTAQQARDGEVAQRDLRGHVDVNAWEAANASKTKDSPLFAVFGKALCDSLNKLLKTDTNATKLDQVAKAMDKVTLREDLEILDQVRLELSWLRERVDDWQKRMIPSEKKVTSIKRV